MSLKNLFPFYYDSNAGSLTINNQEELDKVMSVFGEENMRTAGQADWDLDGVTVYSLFTQQNVHTLGRAIDKYKEQQHPERRENEEFITNHLESDRYEKGWLHFEYHPYRIGEIAYDLDGKPVKGFVPVFKEEEK